MKMEIWLVIAVWVIAVCEIVRVIDALIQSATIRRIGEQEQQAKQAMLDHMQTTVQQQAAGLAAHGVVIKPDLDVVPADVVHLSPQDGQR